MKPHSWKYADELAEGDEILCPVAGIDVVRTIKFVQREILVITDRDHHYFKEGMSVDLHVRIRPHLLV